MSKYISYLLFRAFVFIFWLVPFPLLYMLSNGLAWILRVMAKYRIETINSNLNRVYGNQDPIERKVLIKKIYLNLADVTLEGIKGISMSLETMKSRHFIIDRKLVDELMSKHDNLIIVASHYCNWEWGTGSLADLNLGEVIGVYKKLSNPYIDQYLVKKRSKWGVHMIPTKQTRQELLKEKEHKSIIALASDQSPSNINRAIWIDFLGQKTACIHGPEMYSGLLKAPVIYGHCSRKGRGRYEIRFELLASANEELSEGEITRKFMSCLEKNIEENPANWLWTHKRWKHKYEGHH